MRTGGYKISNQQAIHFEAFPVTLAPEFNKANLISLLVILSPNWYLLTRKRLKAVKIALK
jgi:hypothetical protein